MYLEPMAGHCHDAECIPKLCDVCSGREFAGLQSCMLLSQLAQLAQIMGLQLDQTYSQGHMGVAQHCKEQIINWLSSQGGLSRGSHPLLLRMMKLWLPEVSVVKMEGKIGKHLGLTCIM